MRGRHTHSRLPRPTTHSHGTPPTRRHRETSAVPSVLADRVATQLTVNSKQGRTIRGGSCCIVVLYVLYCIVVLIRVVLLAHIPPVARNPGHQRGQSLPESPAATALGVMSVCCVFGVGLNSLCILCIWGPQNRSTLLPPLCLFVYLFQGQIHLYFGVFGPPTLCI